MLSPDTLPLPPSEPHPPVVAAPPLNLLIVDDHPALRAGLRSLLSSEPGFNVQGDVSSGEEAYAWYRAHQPDVVVMDLSMGGYGGLESLRHILQFDPRARVLIYTVHASGAMLQRALRLGALGYVTKASRVEVLIQGIREVARQQGFVSADLIPAMVRKHAGQGEDASLLEKLSDREFQIMLLTAQGQDAESCAQTLSLSDKTVRNHLTRIKAKLNVPDTAALTRLVIRAGLVEP